MMLNERCWMDILKFIRVDDFKSFKYANVILGAYDGAAIIIDAHYTYSDNEDDYVVTKTFTYDNHGLHNLPQYVKDMKDYELSYGEYGFDNFIENTNEMYGCCFVLQTPKEMRVDQKNENWYLECTFLYGMDLNIVEIESNQYFKLVNGEFVAGGDIKD